VINCSTYQYSCFIPFHLADPAGILFFGNVFGLAHQAFEHFIIDILECSWNSWFQHEEWIVPIVHTEARYSSPLQAGEKCQIELQVIHLSSSSFTMQSSFIQKQPCCVVKTVHAFCHRERRCKIPIPSSLYSKLDECLRIPLPTE
jgi:acyl-CoA thioesterase FadM